MRNRFVCVLMVSILASCGEGPAGTSSPTTPSGATVVSDLPVPPPGCALWPAPLAEFFALVAIPDRVCLIREPGSQPSEYKPSLRRVIYRNPSPVGGEVGSIAHELAHAHQQQVILAAGVPDAVPGIDEGDWLQANWMRTDEGRAYLQAGGYALRPEGCPRSVLTSCWVQDPAGCEMGFCLPGARNPMEDNAEFIQIWYNAPGIPMWSREHILRSAPRRSEWARKYLR